MYYNFTMFSMLQASSDFLKFIEGTLVVLVSMGIFVKVYVFTAALNSVPHWTSANIWKICWVQIISTLFLYYYITLVLFKVVHQLVKVMASIWRDKKHPLVCFGGGAKVARNKKRLGKDSVIYFIISWINPSKELSNVLLNRNNGLRIRSRA